MSKRSCASSSSGGGKSSKRPALIDTERSELCAELVSTSHGTKQSVANVLETLHKRGVLNDPELGATHRERFKLSDASSKHATAATRYGQVVQTVDVPLTDGGVHRWEYINPSAFIYYLSSLVPSFSDVMYDALAASANQCLGLVMYGDELTPGNPLRVDGGPPGV